MIRAIVRRGDGSVRGRKWLDSVVVNVQRALNSTSKEVEIDGWFGPQTETILKHFQSDNKLVPSGVTDKPTWRKLVSASGSMDCGPRPKVSQILMGFHGDIEWLHAREGHWGKPYWAGGKSGVTLDPGIDLCCAEPSLVREQYKGIVTAEQYEALEKAFGLNGENAQKHLLADTVLKSIRISYEQAEVIMPHAAREYWEGVVIRFPSLVRIDTPPSVQTTLLSLAYNLGVNNRYLEPITNLIAACNWTDLADKIGAIQQRHNLPGIRERRRWEADLIRAELEFLEQA